MRRTRRALFGLSAGTTVGYEPQGRSASAIAQAFAVQSNIALGRRTRLELSERTSAAPLDVVRALGAGGADSTLSLPALTSQSGLPASRATTYEGRATLTRILSARSSAAISLASTGSWTARDRAVRSDVLSTRFDRRLGPFSSLHVGYGAGRASFGRALPGAPNLRHDIDVGIAYGRPLPFASHTRFDVGAGSTLLTSGRARRLRLTPTVAVERDFHAGWHARVEYRRPLQFIAGFAEPFLADAISATGGGRVARRVGVSITSMYSRGTIGLGAGPERFASLAASARVSLQAQRDWRVDVEAHDARVAFATPLGSSAAVPDRFMRRGVIASVVWSSPLARH